MNINTKTIKLSFILAVLIAAGFYSYQSIAGAWKVNTSAVNNLTSGLLGYWTFDGVDTSWSGDTATIINKGSLGSGANGVSSGMLKNVSPQPGKIGQSMNFNGSTSYVETNQDGPLELIYDLTLSAWIFPQATTNQRIISKMDTIGFSPYDFRTNGSNLVFQVIDAESNNYLITSSIGAVKLNQWNYVVAVRNSSTREIAFYVNGVLDSGGWTSFAGSGVVPEDTGTSVTTKIGARGNGTQNFFNGQIDEARIYNRVLSASEITELYQQGQTKINASQANKLTNGLVVHYTMDGQDINWNGAMPGALYGGVVTGTVVDKSPSGVNTGSLTDISRLSSPVIGKIGQALNFDAADDNIIKSGASGLPQGNSPFTISAWINFRSSPVAPRYFVSWGDLGTYKTNWFYISSGKLGHTNYSNDYQGDIVLSANAWHHAVITYDGTTRKIYADNIFDKANIPTTMNVTGNDFVVGMDTPGDYPFIGKIDEVRVYNRALSASEVADLYNQGQIKINASQGNKLTNGLVGYWTMDGNDISWAGASTGVITNRGAAGGTAGTTNMLQLTSPIVGKIGQAISFRGDNDYVSVDLSAMNSADAISVSSWVYLRSYVDLNEDTPGFFARGSPSSNSSPALGIGDNGKINFYISTVTGGSGDGNLTTASALPLNQWKHIVATWDNTNMSVFIDGAEDSVHDTTAGHALKDTSTGFIGHTVNGGQLFFPGSMDDVRVYNRVLSTDEINKLYNMGK